MSINAQAEQFRCDMFEQFTPLRVKAELAINAQAWMTHSMNQMALLMSKALQVVDTLHTQAVTKIDDVKKSDLKFAIDIIDADIKMTKSLIKGQRDVQGLYLDLIQEVSKLSDSHPQREALFALFTAGVPIQENILKNLSELQANLQRAHISFDNLDIADPRLPILINRTIKEPFITLTDRANLLLYSHDQLAALGLSTTVQPSELAKPAP